MLISECLFSLYLANLTNEDAGKVNQSDIAAELPFFVTVKDYPEVKYLQEILTKFHQITAYAGELLNVTNRVNYDIAIQPGAPLRPVLTFAKQPKRICSERGIQEYIHKDTTKGQTANTLQLPK